MRFVGLVCVAMWAGCGGDDDKSGEPVGEAGPGAFAEDFDTSSEFFTQMSGPQDAGSVHGQMQIWYSVNLQPLIESGDTFVAPEGSVAIKRQGANMNVYNIMIKLAPGDAPDVGDWYFEQRDEAFAITNSGSIQFCYDCHAGYPDYDLLAGATIQ